MCIDSQGHVLGKGDAVTLTADYIAANPMLTSSGVHDLVWFEISGITNHSECVLVAASPASAQAMSSTGLISITVDAKMTTYSPTGSAWLASTKSQTASTAPQILSANQYPLRSGDIVQLTGKSLHSWGTYNNIKAGDEFVCTLTGLNHPSGCELWLDAIDATLAASLNTNGVVPLYCDAREVNFVRKGALSMALQRAQPAPPPPPPPVPVPPKAVLSQQPGILHQDYAGDNIVAGDIVTLIPTAYSYFGLQAPVQPNSEYRIRAIDQYGLVELEAVDLAVDAEVYIQLGRHLIFTQTGGVLLAATQPVRSLATPYQPVLAPPPEPETGEKKTFDHASLGTDLTGDELMESIRAICGGR